jgi:hypothetical protein
MSNDGKALSEELLRECCMTPLCDLLMFAYKSRESAEEGEPI